MDKELILSKVNKLISDFNISHSDIAVGYHSALVLFNLRKECDTLTILVKGARLFSTLNKAELSDNLKIELTPSTEEFHFHYGIGIPHPTSVRKKFNESLNDIDINDSSLINKYKMAIHDLDIFIKRYW